MVMVALSVPFELEEFSLIVPAAAAAAVVADWLLVAKKKKKKKAPGLRVGSVSLLPNVGVGPNRSFRAGFTGNW